MKRALALGDDSAPSSFPEGPGPCLLTLQRSPGRSEASGAPSAYIIAPSWISVFNSNRKPHTSALDQPTGYPKRQALEPDQISWHTEMADYKPVDFTAPDADPTQSNIEDCRKFADPVQLRRGGGELGGEKLDKGTLNEYLEYLRQPGSNGLGSEALNRARKAALLPPLDPLAKRQTFEGSITFDDHGRPRNPRGRTGLRGRGSLFSWGPNHAVDTIVTRYHPRHDSLQFVAIPRPDDEGKFSLPGNVAKAGTIVAPKVQQILKAEGAVLQESVPGDPATGGEAAAHLDELLQDLFASTEVESVYKGNLYARACVGVCVCAHVNAHSHAHAHAHAPRRTHTVYTIYAIDSLGQATSTTRETPTMRGSRQAPTTSTAAASSAGCCFSMGETTRRKRTAWGRCG